MLQISEQNRDEIVKAIASSVMPTNIGIQIINILNTLKPVEEVKEKSK